MCPFLYGGLKLAVPKTPSLGRHKCDSDGNIFYLLVGTEPYLLKCEKKENNKVF